MVNSCKLSHNRNSEKGSSEKECHKPQSQFTRKILWLNYELVFVIMVYHEISVSVNKKSFFLSDPSRIIVYPCHSLTPV